VLSGLPTQRAAGAACRVGRASLQTAARCATPVLAHGRVSGVVHQVARWLAQDLPSQAQTVRLEMMDRSTADNALWAVARPMARHHSPCRLTVT